MGVNEFQAGVRGTSIWVLADAENQAADILSVLGPEAASADGMMETGVRTEDGWCKKKAVSD